MAAAHGDVVGVVLYPEERRLIADAVQSRRLEFATGRACARAALLRCGVPAGAIPAGADGAPCWPDGIVGSITHCPGYRASAVAPCRRVAALGIDAEPNEPLPPGLLDDVALPQEREWMAHYERIAPRLCWDRLLFAIKEAAYKALSPLGGPGRFTDAEVSMRPLAYGYEVHVRAGLGATGIDTVYGRWRLRDGLLMTAVALSPQQVVSQAKARRR